MSEGLEALKEFRNPQLGVNVYANDYLDIIEKELKEKAKFDAFIKRYNIDSVEELDNFFNQCLNKEIEKCSKCKELEALEIIKKRLIDMQDIVLYKTFSSFNQRRTLRGLLPISKKEFNLLKEVLC